MLAQDEARRTDQTTQQRAEAKPQRGVEVEDERESQQQADGGARRCRVGADLERNVGHRAHHLHRQGTNDDAQRETWHPIQVHQVEQEAVTQDGNDIGHEAALTKAHLVARPAVDLAIKEDAEARQDYREQINHEQHRQAERPGHQTQVAEEQQSQKCERRQVEG